MFPEFKAIANFDVSTFEDPAEPNPKDESLSKRTWKYWNLCPKSQGRIAEQEDVEVLEFVEGKLR